MAKSLIVAETPVQNRLGAARGLLNEYLRDTASPHPDFRAWAARLAGALSSVTSLADEAIGLNREMSAIFTEILEGTE